MTPDPRRIDITADRCPMTFVRTRLALDKLAPGDLLEVLLSGEEPRRSVPDATRGLGHEVVSICHLEGGQTRLLIRKK